MEQNNEAKIWLEKTNALSEALTHSIETGDLSIFQIAEFISDASRAIIKRERFYNPYANSKYETSLNTLYNYIQLTMTCESGIIMIPLQVSLLESGQLGINELVDYMHESIMIKLGIEDNYTDISSDEEESEIEKKFNALIYKIDCADEREDYEEALYFLDEAFEIAENESLFFYDRVTMINNRAFYNYKLGNLDVALADAEKAIAENPNDDLPYHTKAEILMAMKSYPSALQAINKAISIYDSEDKQEFKKLILAKM